HVPKRRSREIRTQTDGIRGVRSGRPHADASSTDLQQPVTDREELREIPGSASTDNDAVHDNSAVLRGCWLLVRAVVDRVAVSSARPATTWWASTPDRVRVQ